MIPISWRGLGGWLSVYGRDDLEGDAMTKHPKRPRDPNQLVKLVVDMATGDQPRDDGERKTTKTTSATDFKEEIGGRIGRLIVSQ